MRARADGGNFCVHTGVLTGQFVVARHVGGRAVSRRRSAPSPKQPTATTVRIISQYHSHKTSICAGSLVSRYEFLIGNSTLLSHQQTHFTCRGPSVTPHEYLAAQSRTEPHKFIMFHLRHSIANYMMSSPNLVALHLRL